MRTTGPGDVGTLVSTTRLSAVATLNWPILTIFLVQALDPARSVSFHHVISVWNIRKYGDPIAGELGHWAAQDCIYPLRRMSAWQNLVSECEYSVTHSCDCYGQRGSRQVEMIDA